MFDISNFGIKVFDEKIMKKKLPSPIYKNGWMLCIIKHVH